MAEDNGQSAEGTDDGRPDWLPENFANPEALLASYKELQGAHTRVSQEKAAIEDNYADIASRLDEIAAQQQQTPQQQQYVNPNDQLQALADQFGVEPEVVSTAAYIAQQTAQEIFKQQQEASKGQNELQLQALRGNAITLAKNKLEAVYPDWSTVQDQVAEVVQNNPHLISDNDLLSPEAIFDRFSSVYKQVKYDELVNGASSEGGSQQPDLAALMERMKLQAQTASGASGRPDSIADEKASWEAIKNAAPKNYYD